VRVKVGLVWQQRASGAYATLRWTEGGERRSESLGYVTPAEAERRRGDREAEIRLGLSSTASTPHGPPAVGRLVEEYLRVLEDGARGTAVYRRHETAHAIRIDAHLGRLAAHRVTEAHIRRMVATLLAEEPAIPTDPAERKHRERGIAKKSSVLDLLGCLRRIYKAGRDAGLVDVEPPRLPRGALTDDARPARQLTDDELGRLVAAASAMRPAFGRLVLFLAWCPRRPVAIFDIRREDCARIVDPTVRRRDAKLYVRRDKAGRGRGWCPLTEPALQVLREHLAAMEDTAPGARVWTSSTGRPLDTALLAEPFRRAVKAAGIGATNPYDLRKFGAVRVHAATGNLHVTAEYTGHQDVHTLLARYLSAPQGAADEMASRITWAPAALRVVEDDA